MGFPTLFSILLPLHLAGAAAAQGTIAISGVTLIDGTDRPARPGTTILVRDGRVAAVGTDAEVHVPAGTVRVDGRGGFVIPGLWDCHVHLTQSGRGSLPMFLRFGVTSVRDLGGIVDTVLAYRAAIRNGQVVGPRILAAGPIIEDSTWLAAVSRLDLADISDLVRHRFGVSTPAQAERAVDSIAKLGVEIVKVRTTRQADAYAAVMAAAQRHGLLTAGHQPAEGIGLAGALAAGQRSIEHIEGLGELEAMPVARRDSVAHGIAAAQMWITPTLVAVFSRFRPESVTVARIEGTASEDPWKDLVTPELRRFWRAQLAMKKYDSPLDFYRKLATEGLAGMRRLTGLGVKLLVGTDLGVPLLYPGLGVHEEMALLVDSLGVTPLRAIQAATVEPARYARMSDSLGTIEPGKIADLVILDANPLENIRNTRKIRLVMTGGRIRP